MFETIKDLFKKKPVVEKFQEEKEEKKDIGRVYGDKDTFEYGYDLLELTNEKRREYFLTHNMDRILSGVKSAISDFPYLSRTIMNITGKTAQQDFYFEGENIEKVKKVALEFQRILKESNYSSELFLRESFNNLIKYSNLFIIPFRDKEQNIERVRIIQNQGWTVHEKIGTSFCVKFHFNPGIEDGGKEYKNKIDVFHITFNKESDEIFALPIWCSVIRFLKKYDTLIDNALISYRDQSITRIIYEIGVNKAGQRVHVTPTTYDKIKDLLEHTDADLITDSPINANKVEKDFSSPDQLLEALENQIVSGLYTSKNQLGFSSTGRQDSEVQDENTKLIAEDFSSTLQYSLTQTLIKNICIKLFGNFLGENEIKLKFHKNFNTRERIEKHAVFLFQGGVIDLDEARKMLLKEKNIQKDKTFFELYQQSEMNGLVENTNNPKNQHTSGTGTTKKTTKN